MNTLPSSFSLDTPLQWLHGTARGLLLSTAIALLALGLAAQPWAAAHGLSALTLAIVLGLLLGNTVYPRLATASGPGVGLAKQQLLRAGLVLYALRLTFQDIAQVGWSGIALDALVLASTFGLAWWPALLGAVLVTRALARADRDAAPVPTPRHPR